MKLPRRIVVKEVLSSRYGAGERPDSWDLRSPGLESIRTEGGEQLNLYCKGGQSSPDVGWELLLTQELQAEDLVPELTTASSDGEQGAHVQSAHVWTLYGVKKQA